MNDTFDFFKSISLKEIFYLIIGGVIGFFTNLIFYYRSKSDNNEKNFDRLIKTYENLNKLPDYDLKLKEIKEEIGTKNSLEKLTQEILDIKENVLKNPTPDEVIKYQILGENWSIEYLKSIRPRILDKDGYLFYYNILEFHKTIFPNDFVWAGKIRKTEVVMNNSFETIMPETMSVVDYNIIPAPPQTIFGQMEKYCNRWNISVSSLLTEKKETKIENIARFHHEFLLIHPFIDGNGRISRIILNDMSEYLLNKKLDVSIEKERYLSTLRFADMGDFTQLITLFKEIIQ